MGVRSENDIWLGAEINQHLLSLIAEAMSFVVESPEKCNSLLTLDFQPLYCNTNLPILTKVRLDSISFE